MATIDCWSDENRSLSELVYNFHYGDIKSSNGTKKIKRRVEGTAR